MKKEKLNFRVNVGLKDIVGRELINNDHIAIIELIKNSKDARSKKVDITFLHATEENSKSMLVIQDIGKGMSPQDVYEKWLNLAYSEKRGEVKSVYAGSKGIGRFSCDRLGKVLDLYTKKKNGEVVKLHVDWLDFEVLDKDKEFSAVDVQQEVLTDSQFETLTKLKRFSSGTVLVITQLRAGWNERKLKSLKKELERFVVDPKSKFKVYLYAKEYKKVKDLNGEVENKIFEKLGFRTTSIHSTISPNGREITTTLKHDGHNLFILKEKNPFKAIKDINCSIYYLGQGAKVSFNYNTGYRSVEFGSIFLFLNGFRVFPYGNEGDDWLGLDKRKSQGYNRYLGTRELVGFVEINDKDNSFAPVSSREGLVNNNAFQELAIGGKERQRYSFTHKAIRKLEKFVVEGLDWDRLVEDLRVLDDETLLKTKLKYVDKKHAILGSLDSVINLGTKINDVLDINLNSKYLLSLAKTEKNAHKEFTAKIEKKLSGKSLSKMKPSDKKALTKFISQQTKIVAAKERTNKDLSKKTVKLKKEKQEVNRKLDVETKKRLFAEASTTLDYQHVLDMHHQIGSLANNVFKQLNGLLQKNSRNPNSVTKNVLISAIEKSIFNIDKIQKASKFSTKANFNMATNKVKTDIVQFISEYVDKVCENGADWGVRISVENKSQVELVDRFRPIELTMVVDNILDNAAKAKSRNMSIRITRTTDVTRIRFIDNGKGLDTSKYKNADFFEKGITTTSGSGIGLYHITQIISEMNGLVKIANNKDKGANVLLEFKNENRI